MTRTPAVLAAALFAMSAQAQTPQPAAPAPQKKTFEMIAERSNITLSGRAWASFENVKADSGSTPAGTAVKSYNRLTNNASYLRIEGETELTAGWKALAQIEAEFGIEGEAGAPFSGTRNTGVGLDSPYGRLILGRWDSPMKQTTIGLDPFGGTGILGYYNVFGQQQGSATGQGANRWDRRLNNSLNYRSPVFSGLRVLAAYSVGEASTYGAIKVNPWTASAAVHYRQGPLYVGAAYETRTDCGNPDADGGSAPVPACRNAALGSATQPNGTDSGFRVGASYEVKQTWTKIAAAYEHVSLQADATAADAKKTLQRDVYWGTITQGLGSNTHNLILAYGYATDVSGQNVFADTKDTGAQYFTAAYRFYFDKNTDLYAGYVQLKNRKNATYRFGSMNFGAVAVGSTSEGFSAGLRYLF